VHNGASPNLTVADGESLEETCSLNVKHVTNVGRRSGVRNYLCLLAN